MSVDAFRSFWNDWFSVAITGIRHSRLINEFWKRGYIMGFISKVGAENLLNGQRCPPGTFLLRFSERAPGSFAIAYTKVGVVLCHVVSCCMADRAHVCARSAPRRRATS